MSTSNIDDKIIVNVVERDRNQIPRHVTLAYRHPQGVRFSFIPSQKGNGAKAILTHRCGGGDVPEEVFRAIEQKATQCLQPD